MKRQGTLNELREWIEEYKKYLMNLGELGDKIVQVLILRDKINNLMHKLEEKGADLSVEKSKLDTLDHIIKDEPQTVWKKLKDCIDPAAYRVKQKIPPCNWWWYLDQIIRNKKKQLINKWIKRTVIGVSFVTCLYFIFVYAIPKPDPYTTCIQEGERLLQKGKINPALQTYQKATYLNPEKPYAYLMVGVIYQFLGEDERAKKYFREAKKRYTSSYDFHLERGTIWMKLGKFSAAEEDAKQALKLNPASAEAHFLLGNAYEAQDKIAQAIAEFSIVSEMKTDPKLIVIARYKIGMLSLKQVSSSPASR